MGRSVGDIHCPHDVRRLQRAGGAGAAAGGGDPRPDSSAAGLPRPRYTPEGQIEGAGHPRLAAAHHRHRRDSGLEMLFKTISAAG
ncbi:hypothetical protein LNO81_19425 [Klebsiella variicola subsp. variicola]|nr:hypothetical protein [Klebsiella variicola subsp. variicola]